MGLDPILRARKRHVYGILNGVDTQAWSPKTDPHIPAHFSLQDMSGKAVCKAHLQRELGLPVRDDRPMFGFISRLDFQKGVDQIEAITPWLMSRGARLFCWGQETPPAFVDL